MPSAVVVTFSAFSSSSNFLVSLQAFAQIPYLNIWYGPDSYMGANITKLFQQMAMMSDEEIAEIHPKHNRDSITSLLPRLHYYQVKCLFLVLEEQIYQELV